MENNFHYVEKQISETYVEKEIKLEPEVPPELDPLEYVNVTVKSETLESCDPELDEFKPPEYVNVSVKSEVFESCESESIDDLPSFKIKQEAELRNPEYVNVAVKSETLEICEPESVSSLSLSKFTHEDELKSPEYVDVSVKYEILETCESESESGLPLCKIKQEVDGCSKQAQNSGYCVAHGGKQQPKNCGVKDCSKRAKKGGYCIAHGGKQQPKKCGVEDCLKHSKKVKSSLFDVQPKMEDSFTNEVQQISETFIKQEIKSEPEAELHPPEFVNMAIKTEIPESCEPESVSDLPSFKDKHEVHYEKTSLVNSPFESEVSDNDMITGLSSCSLPPIFEDNKVRRTSNPISGGLSDSRYIPSRVLTHADHPAGDIQGPSGTQSPKRTGRETEKVMQFFRRLHLELRTPWVFGRHPGPLERNLKPGSPFALRRVLRTFLVFLPAPQLSIKARETTARDFSRSSGGSPTTVFYSVGPLIGDVKVALLTYSSLTRPTQSFDQEMT
uniref:WRKY19-like zinc finger domain-containing protein n=1 Tax=Timema monikensis TaxID=170555 RepID=A0A7R9E8A7_9NEOP|nr:unnamed protein product [Timema monikensis]